MKPAALARVRPARFDLPASLDRRDLAQDLSFGFKPVVEIKAIPKAPRLVPFEGALRDQDTKIIAWPDLWFLLLLFLSFRSRAFSCHTRPLLHEFGGDNPSSFHFTIAFLSYSNAAS
jgi:hypothetical protein